MKHTACIKCSHLFRNCNFKKHEASCDGNYTPFIKATNCKWCDLPFDGLVGNASANHTRWCDRNPNRKTYGNDGSQMQTPESIKKRTAGIKKAWADGKYDGVNHSHPGWKHTLETKQNLREKALASPHRRLRRSIRDYVKKDGTVVKLDSSWEEALAKRLDSINIDWTRPSPIRWVDDDNVSHNYFPDFYLVDFDVYLDPKNPYAIKAQQSKINCLTSQIPNLIIITTLEECNNFTPKT